MPTSGPAPAAAAASVGLHPLDDFAPRHLGPSDADIDAMLDLLGFDSLDALTDAAVPAAIRSDRPLDLPAALTESEALARLRACAGQNQVFRSFIGMGYSGTITPGVILRNILENPGWYTQYTPYQAEISQGRLEALLNFQTMIADLTALPLAGASLLDEATAAAEAMAMCHSVAPKRGVFVIAADCHPQTIGVVRTRAHSLGIELVVAPATSGASGGKPLDLDGIDLGAVCGVLVQYPTTDGRIECYEDIAARVHDAGALVVCAADLLALTLIRPPGEWGADIAVGSAQRFGVPMGFGGPHAAYIATRDAYARKMPGRIIGVSKDAYGNTALRMAIQTREQHIKRERATSNICTAQALLAIMASMYAVYHGPHGLRRIAERVHLLTQTLRAGLLGAGHEIAEDLVFDTLRIRPATRSADELLKAARGHRINLRNFGDGTVGISLDEATTAQDITDLLAIFGVKEADLDALAAKARADFPGAFARTSDYLTHPVFNSCHCETEMLRYITQLQRRDLSLADSMIPLGSCTMKLNATSEMIPVTWPEFASLHPFAPADQTAGYRAMFAELESWLAEITGFGAVSLQPNAGSQGEYAGLLVIRAYHADRGEAQRDICLIPTSAHGTNPASAIIAGMRVVPVKCDDRGNIDLADLRAKAEQHAAQLGALMITYPSTHGVFEETVREICAIVHEHGGLVYMDGANLNAQVGLTRPAELGADVCHLNLHKTFCIPHGGGGPGMGPIGVTGRLAPFLPGHPVVTPFGAMAEARAARGVTGAGSKAIGPVSAAPWGSPSILTISWMYIAMMGAAGLKKATQVAILNANYMAKRLEDHYDTLYTGPGGLVAHEFIIDCRAFEKSAQVRIDDVAKRLMDYGFHAPTMAWPVPGTLMIEPTESEPKEELDRFCDALIAIREEIREIERGDADAEDNLLHNAPHTIAHICSDDWAHPYSRQRAAYPAPWLRDRKFWPHVGRVDNAYGDRHLVCTCPPMEAYE
ncbi:MAG: aminomethyl-transferring glycine dehydrogenase [Phycisphaerales bacterium JB039]